MKFIIITVTYYLPLTIVQLGYKIIYVLFTKGTYFIMTITVFVIYQEFVILISFIVIALIFFSLCFLNFVVKHLFILILRTFGLGIIILITSYQVLIDTVVI